MTFFATSLTPPAGARLIQRLDPLARILVAVVTLRLDAFIYRFGSELVPGVGAELNPVRLVIRRAVP